MKNFIWILFVIIPVLCDAQSLIILELTNTKDNEILFSDLSSKKKDIIKGHSDGTVTTFQIEVKNRAIKRYYVEGLKTDEGDEIISLIVSPNSTLTIFGNCEDLDETLRFVGDGAALNRYDIRRFLDLESFETGIHIPSYKTLEDLEMHIDSSLNYVLLNDKIYNDSLGIDLFTNEVSQIKDILRKKFIRNQLKFNLDSVFYKSDDYKTYSISSKIDTTLPTLIFHTADWCKTCENQVEYYNKLVEKHSNTFNFLVIAIRSEQNKWEKKQDLYDGIKLLDRNLTASTFKLIGIPSFSLFDQSRNLIAIDLPLPNEGSLNTILNDLEINLAK